MHQASLSRSCAIHTHQSPLLMMRRASRSDFRCSHGSWIFCADSYNVFQVGSGGKTACQRLKGKQRASTRGPALPARVSTASHGRSFPPPASSAPHRRIVIVHEHHSLRGWRADNCGPALSPVAQQAQIVHPPSPSTRLPAVTSPKSALPSTPARIPIWD